MGKNNNKDFIIGSLVGGLIGAAAALFLTPKSGKEVRDNLSLQASMIKDRTEKMTSEALEKSSGLANAAKERTASLSQVVSEQSSQIMDKVRDITSNSKGQSNLIEKEVEDALEQVSEGTSSIEAAGHSKENLSNSIEEAAETILKDELKEQPQSPSSN